VSARELQCASFSGSPRVCVWLIRRCGNEIRYYGAVALAIIIILSATLGTVCPFPLSCPPSSEGSKSSHAPHAKVSRHVMACGSLLRVRLELTGWVIG
jgi:hypothetical protein